ncbi:hypothetical protein KIPB_014469, partial [Kipferlia bialata]
SGIPSSRDRDRRGSVSERPSTRQRQREREREGESVRGRGGLRGLPSPSPFSPASPGSTSLSQSQGYRLSAYNGKRDRSGRDTQDRESVDSVRERDRERDRQMERDRRGSVTSMSGRVDTDRGYHRVLVAVRMRPANDKEIRDGGVGDAVINTQRGTVTCRLPTPSHKKK